MPKKCFTIFKFCLLSVVSLGALLSWEAVAAANSISPLVASRFDIVGSKLHGQPPVAIADLQAMEPACELVLRYQKRWDDNPNLGIWYIQLKNSPLLDLPENNIAKDAVSFHHYCWGEVVRNRYYRETDAKKRKELAEYAMSGSKYVIDHPEFRPQQWPYLSHVYVTMGTGYLLMKDTASAINAFLMSLQINPRERIAYIRLADTLSDLGKKPDALKHVTEGLKYFPKNKGLIRRYQDFGGKLPYPEPYPDIEINSSDAPAPHTAKTTVPEASDTQSKAIDQEPEKNSAPTEATSPPASNKLNPYCRFCP